MTILLAIATIAGLAATAFCSGLETAFLSVSRGRVTHLAREGSRSARIVLAALRDMGSTTTSILIGNNIANVVFSSCAAALGARLVEGPGARSAWTFLSALAVLYLSEFLPKLLCSTRPLRRILALAPAFRVFSRVFSPVTSVAVAVTNLFIPKTETKESVNANELMRILKDRKDGVKLTDFESAMIARILVMRKNGEFITPDSLLLAIDEEDV
ncbi:MAG: DUF21 domain-containing protein [Kiritimatiellae bacterium]|nr:DUF21 domain-containing protein [Kiritimatiellia bacterium]